jgi:hypothetical protein
MSAFSADAMALLVGIAVLGIMTALRSRWQSLAPVPVCATAVGVMPCGPWRTPHSPALNGV